MRHWKLSNLALGAAISMLLIFVAAPASAEDTGVFKNSRDISRAQRILVTEGHLAAGSYTLGSLDDATRQALSEYQSEHSLNETSTLDDDTFQTLLAHEVSYPWGAEQYSDTVTAPLEPAEPIAAAEPEPAPELAEAPPAPEPTPSTAEVREAPAEPEPAYEPTRSMPATASPLPLLLLSGVVLIGSGFLLLRRRSA